MYIPPSFVTWNQSLLFVHVPKTGGSSVERALADSMGVHWLATRVLSCGQMGDPREWGKRVHLPDGEGLRLLHECHGVKDVVSFATVRHPYAVARSAFNWLNSRRNQKPVTCRQFREKRYFRDDDRDGKERHVFTYPSHAFLGPCTLLFDYNSSCIWRFLAIARPGVRQMRINSGVGNETFPCSDWHSDPTDAHLYEHVRRRRVVIPQCSSLPGHIRRALIMSPECRV